MSYITREAQYMIGTKASTVTLTAAYAGNVSSAFNVESLDQLALAIYFAAGTVTDTLEWKIEFANPLNGDPVTADWEAEVSTSTVAGVTTVHEKTHTFTSSAATHLLHPDFPVHTKWIRVSVKNTAAGAHGTCYVKLIERHAV